MHELGLAEDILRKLKEEAEKRSLAKISFAKVAVGETLISDLPELKELLTMISAGSAAEGAVIEIELVPVKAICADCKKEFAPKAFRLDCAACGSTNIQISAGRELSINELN